MLYLVRDIKIYVNNEASFINYCPNTIYIRKIYIYIILYKYIWQFNTVRKDLLPLKFSSIKKSLIFFIW